MQLTLESVDPKNDLKHSELAVEPALIEMTHTTVDLLDDAQCFKAARHRFIDAAYEDYEFQVLLALRKFGDDTGPLEAVFRLNSLMRHRLVAATHQTWLADRPGRGRMPRAYRVAEHWERSARFPEVDVDRPTCFRCRVRADEWMHLERAHLCDRARDGLDNAANLAMLCNTCHRQMPHFNMDQGLAALDWIRPMRRELTRTGHAGAVYGAILGLESEG